ncbi:MFS transporter [Natronorarus salvus]|uniref:MFS transporter n=1 Tax=Natronorarus salvus TaxID=3117733 RepID=UPI002F264A61
MTEVAHPRVVGPITAGHGVNEFFAIVVPPIIPLLVADFGISYGQAGFLLTVFFAMYVLFQLPAGALADRIGKRRLLVGGLFGMAAGIALAATASTYGTLVVAQTIAGIGGATFHPTGMAIVSDVETERTEGKAMGVFGFGGALGTLSAPLVVGGLAALFGWRVALAGAVALGTLVTLAILPSISDGGEGDDGDGRTTLSDGGRQFSPGGALRSVRSAVAVPVTRGVVILFLVTLVLSLQHRAIQTFTTAYVGGATGGSISVGNLAFFTLLLGGSVASLWAGDLADRFDRRLLGVGAALATAGLVATTLVLTDLLGGLPPVALIAVLAVWFALIGVGMYASYPVKNALVSEQADAAYSGSLFGVIQTASAVGSASGPAIVGVLSDRWGVAAAFPAIAAASVLLAGLFGLLLLGE